MEGRKSVSRTWQFNHQISDYSRQKLYIKAIATYEKMRECQIEPDVVTFNTMIHLYMKIQKIKNAFDLLAQMRSAGIPPTVVTFTCLIDGCGKCGHFDKVMELYNDAMREKIEPNSHFFNTLLNAAFLNGNAEEAENFLRDLSKYPMWKNAVTYNTLITGYSRMEMLQKVAEVVDEIVSRHMEATVNQTSIALCSQLIRNEKDLDVYLDILNKLHVVIDADLSTNIITDLVKRKLLMVAGKVVKRFVACKFEITAQSLRDLAKLAGEYGNIVILLWIDSYCTAHSLDIKDDMDIAMLNAYAKLGNIEEVKARYMQKCVPISTRLDVIQCMLQHSVNTLATEIAKGVVTEYSISAKDKDRLFQMFSDRMLDKEIMMLFQLIRRRIAILGNKASDCIMKAMIGTSIDTEIVCQLRPSLVTLLQLVKNCTPELANQVRWNTVIETCMVPPTPSLLFEFMNELMKKGQKNATWSAFHHFVKMGVCPSPNSLELALQSQTGTNNHENLKFLLETARDNGIKENSVLLNTALESALENGNLTLALQIKMEMEANLVEMNPEIKVLYDSHIKTLMCALPTPQKDITEPKITVPRSNTIIPRQRSKTLPPKIDQCSGMEETAYRSAMLVVGIDNFI